LKQRRTWREFGSAPIPLDRFGTLLDLAFGRQAEATTSLGVRVPLKTSPSPGGTQSLEAYVVALNVADVPTGIYWYDSAAHHLQEIRGTVTPRSIGTWLGGQWWFEGAGVVVLLTGVLERIQRRYRDVRAYRSWLLEAGHVCQTFCLTATWLDLAPFCTQALADTRIEKRLGIEPGSETVLYAMGAGTKPPGRAYVPWPAEHAEGNPFIRPRRQPTSRSRSRS
jgi:SagB-type dehydrogenase family enzyme